MIQGPSSRIPGFFQQPAALRRAPDLQPTIIVNVTDQVDFSRYVMKTMQEATLGRVNAQGFEVTSVIDDADGRREAHYVRPTPGMPNMYTDILKGVIHLERDRRNVLTVASQQVLPVDNGWEVEQHILTVDYPRATERDSRTLVETSLLGIRAHPGDVVSPLTLGDWRRQIDPLNTPAQPGRSFLHRVLGIGRPPKPFL